MSRKYFITGTDTEVGKTWVSCALVNLAAQQDFKALGLKPVAAGAEHEFDGQLENEDALALLSASNVKIPIRELNPVCLPEPLSPHISAERAGAELSVEHVQTALSGGLSVNTDLTLVEGAGGWRVPINNHETMADLAKALSLPVILVVGMRLGCLNHALLTAEAIRADGLQLAGWVANELSTDMPAIEENVATLKRHISAPMLARFSFGQVLDVSIESHGLDINKLVE